jgi:hypothetical protein
MKVKQSFYSPVDQPRSARPSLPLPFRDLVFRASFFSSSPCRQSLIQNNHRRDAVVLAPALSCIIPLRDRRLPRKSTPSFHLRPDVHLPMLQPNHFLVVASSPTPLSQPRNPPDALTAPLLGALFWCFLLVSLPGPYGMATIAALNTNYTRNMTNGNHHSPARRPRRYTVSHLLELAPQSQPAPFDLSKFTYDAARGEYSTTFMNHH